MHVVRRYKSVLIEHFSIVFTKETDIVVEEFSEGEDESSVRVSINNEDVLDALAAYIPRINWDISQAEVRKRLKKLRMGYLNLH